MITTGLPSRDELILFRKRKEPSLGIFVNTVGDKITLFSEEGKEMSADPGRIAFSSGMKIEGDLTQSEKKLKLRDVRRFLDEKKDEIDLVTIWECFEGTEGEVSFDEISGLYFGGEEADSEDVLALFWAVDKGGVYFTRGEAGYQPRSREEAEELIRKRDAEERRKKEKEEALYWAKGVLSGHIPEESGEVFDPSEYIEMIRRYVIHLDKFGRAGEVKSFLAEIGIRDAEGAIEFLVKAGGWEEDEDPMLRRFGIRDDFPEAVEKQAHDLIPAPVPTEGFTDLTHLEVFSIDDENTEDIDDALSIRETPEGAEIGIHISNVASIIEKWSPSDEEASKRGETIYLPEKRIHMFPRRLIKEKLSLIEGTERACLSLLVVFGEEMEVKSHRFVNSILKISKNLNYTQGSEYFETDQNGIRFGAIAARLREKRLEAGALIVQLPQLKIRVDENKEISIEKNYMNTVAHVVVAEMMILLNRMAGKYLKDRQIPAIYRSQPEPVPEEAKSYDDTDLLYPVQIVRFLRAPRVGLSPEPHMSLGLDVYTQVSSPIRRYADLVMQRQIVYDLLYGDTAYTEEELENLYPLIEVGIRDKRTVERARDRYWLYKYMKALEGNVIEGIVSSVTDRRTSLYLPDFLFETSINSSAAAGLETGSKIRLKVHNVDPLRKTLRLTPLPQN